MARNEPEKDKIPSPAHLRQPPQSIETEESLLSAILIDNKTLLDVIEILSPEDFYKPAHQKIFDAITDLFKKNEPADLVTVHNILKEKGQLEQAGGVTYLSWLLDSVPVAVNASYYARIVRDKACLRHLIGKANSITRKCFEDSGNVDEVIDFAERAIFEISENKISPSFYPIGRIIEDNIDALEKRQENKALITGVPTGFGYFDQLTAGFQNSDLIILAARPSQGKTALALNIARNAAVDSGIPVAVFSLEMSKEQLSMRMLCAEARVDSSRVRSGFFSQEDWLKLTDAAGKLSQSPIFIDDSASISDMEIRAKARRLKMNENLGLIIIDYLQLMKGRASAERRDLEIAEISRSLKALAKELDLPVVALSQLNRKLEERGDKRPILSDLRESGCLSGDTRIVLSNGDRIAIRDMAEQKQLAEVLSMNEHNLKTEAMKISNAFSTGIHSVYRLETASGRQLKATANHKFRTLAEWKRLDQLMIGEHIAVSKPVMLSGSDIYWDKIRNIEYSGEEETFDLTVPIHHNFIANDIFAHNSLEQDADVVAFIYRDEVYNKDENNPARGKAEIIIAKQRNGPVGTVNLSFINKYTRFENPAPEM
jgi:replicative DNA helicase